MITILAWPAALVTGLSLGLLGSGGSIIIIPVLIYLCGLDEKIAIASALVIVGCISVVGAIPYIRRQQVRWGALFWFGLPGMVGTYIGAWLAIWISGLVQLILFALVMLVAAWFMLRRTPVSDLSSSSRRPLYQLVSGGAMVGVLTGMVGVGGGFLIVPALIFLGGLTMPYAVATSMVIITGNAFVGFYKYLSVLNGQGLSLNMSLIVMMSVLGIVGSFAGSRLALIIPQQRLRQIFAIFLIIMGGYILVHSALKMHLIS